MSVTVKLEHSSRKAERLRKLSRCASVQVTPIPERRTAANLNSETRIRYDLDPGDSVAACIAALLLAGMTLTFGVGFGLARAVGLR